MEKQGVRVGGRVREAADGGRSSGAGGRGGWPQPTAEDCSQDQCTILEYFPLTTLQYFKS